MKILILGGTSFFGRELAVLCAERGDDVTVFSRRCPAYGLPPKIKQVRGDRTVRPDLVRMSIDRWDVVVDNICFGTEDAQNAVETFGGRAGLWIFTSSEAVYYTLRGITSPYREIHTELLGVNEGLRGRSDFFEYAFGKKDAEKVFLNAWLEKKFPVSIIRFPIVIGPGDHTLRAYSYWLRIADGGPLLLPGGAFRRRFIYSKDAAKALDTVARGRGVLGEVFNFGDSVAVSLREWVDLSASIMDRTVEKMPVTFEQLKGMGIKPLFSPYSSRRDTVLDIEKAEKAFNWKSSQMRDWMKETIDWFFLKYSGPAPDNYSGRKTEGTLLSA